VDYHLHHPWSLFGGFPRALGQLSIVLSATYVSCDFGPCQENRLPYSPGRIGSTANICPYKKVLAIRIFNFNNTYALDLGVWIDFNK